MSFSHSPLARINTTLNRLFLAGLLAAAGASAIAQTAPNVSVEGNSQAAIMAAAKHRAEQAKADQPMGQADKPAMGHKMDHHDSAKMQARMDRHMREFKTKLMITPAQEGAWTNFTAAMQPPAHTGAQRMSHEQRRAQRAEMDKLTLPERIDKTRAMRTERMNELSAQMDKREQAAKTLYAALSPEQQKVMDAEHRKMSRHGHRGMDKGMKKDMPKEMNNG
ncbi:hypothetical protein HC248_00042 [Polaromonas vacuolata]|uniref:LTXXQ motif family protein n=1 Tax=Polaromonas vacuolata TaxID=37448 RepID=A0A6H2H4K9_9BURK|nr:Spy/CpxP family protein refolding chaperone [Polaromonas vacuolata]QJC54780.1 hypothetical protein HC248_00042 [Polaromonas vacuolata]